MQYWCSDLGIDDIKLRCSLLSSLVQPFLSYGCGIWGLERPDNWCQMLSIHHMFVKRTLHVRKATPSDVVLCELGEVPLPLCRYKILLQYVARLVDEDEQHFLFDCPLYSGIRQLHTVLFASDQGSIRLFLERNADQTPPTTFTCAFRPGCPMSYIWLPQP